LEHGWAHRDWIDRDWTSRSWTGGGWLVIGLCWLGLSACSSEPTAPCPAPPKPSAEPFVDATETLGVEATHHFATDFCKLTDTIGGPGVCLFDFDGDSDLDIYFVDRSGHSNSLFRNDGARFEEVGKSAGVALEDQDSMGCLAFDYDSDGDLDLYVTANGPDQLLRNDDGVFQDVSAAVGLQADGFSISASAGDIDGDGDLDLFVGRAVKLATCPDECALFPIACDADSNLLFENRDGSFVDVSAARGLNAVEPTLATVMFDKDGDGDLDLYVGNDMGVYFPDRFYVNDGNGYFVDQAVPLGLDAPGTDTMGVDVGDYDQDGLTDLVITDFKHRPIRLFHCVDPELPCSNDVAPDGLDYVKWGVGFVDFDHDVDIDLMVATGDVAYLDGNPTHLYFNQGGNFVEYHGGAGSPLSAKQVSRGLAFGDLDGDGDVDAVIANAGGSHQVLLNQTAAGHSLTVELDTLAAGARVTVSSEAGKITEHAVIGGSYAGSSDPQMHFGLGASCTCELTVRYLDGSVRSLSDVAAGRVRISR